MWFRKVNNYQQHPEIALQGQRKEVSKGINLERLFQGIKRNEGVRTDSYRRFDATGQPWYE